MTQENVRAYLGSFFHAPTYGEFEYLENALIEVDGNGVITRVVTGDDPSQQEFILAHRKAGTITELPEGSYGLPGFVDMHVHSCQWPQAALALWRLTNPSIAGYRSVRFLLSRDLRT